MILDMGEWITDTPFRDYVIHDNRFDSSRQIDFSTFRIRVLNATLPVRCVRMEIGKNNVTIMMIDNCFRYGQLHFGI